MSPLALSIPRISKAKTLARLGWASLLVMHGMPLVKGLADGVANGLTWPRAGGLTFLLLATAFFALKTLGVRFLRVRCRKTALVVFLACCGLAHGDRAAELAKNNHLATPAIVAAGTAAVFGPRIRRRLPELIKTIRDALASLLAPKTLVCYAARESQIQWSFVPRARRSPPRGPPR